MASRILRRAAALGLAAGAAGSLHAVATWNTPNPVLPYDEVVRSDLLESVQQLIQSALLRAYPLSGVHLRDVRTRAEHHLVRVDAEGPEYDPAAATDLRLLLALLAARDGRPDDALQLYAEAARDSPFDKRPRALAYYICLLTGRTDGANEWNAAYRRLVPHSEILNPYNYPGYDEVDSYELTDLIDELVVAASIGGVWSLEEAAVRLFVAHSAHGGVDAGLGAAVKNKTLPTAERLLFRALRAYLRAKMNRLTADEIVSVLENYSSGRR
ncbi:hypothetical protein GUJ93_ZPchr0001g29561 [Zizania palustris]|uniref:Tetratricopeptide repeat protein n=1 Tax=Zizania palustris TaxID=103762 RepID=A0A8J5RUM0_ZIZPA|nr:hypothetical protein GUJ93_ZPchr0001g29561 [Zizania palustris]